MKKRFVSLFLVGLLVFGVFVTPAAAATTRASDQLARYYSDLVPDRDGRFGIVFSVSGTNTMKKIGAKQIQIYEQVGSRWSPAATFDSSMDGMCDVNTFAFANTIYYSGTPGTYYKVVVTVFAENAAGSDSRTETHYITA